MYDKREKRKYIFYITTSFIFLLFIIVNLNNTIKEENNQIAIIDDVKKDIIEAKEDIKIEDTNNKEEVKVVKNEISDYFKYIKESTTNINFNNLLEKNNDTKGWLKVNNTNINYPFVQTNNNDFYLDHSFNKSYNKSGWVFLDYRNKINELSKNTIIYGHGRVNKTMFGTLEKTLSLDWYQNKSNHIITTFTKEKTYRWQVFSTYITKSETFYLRTLFGGNDDYLIFLNTLKERSNNKYDVILNKDDKILTLSTCHGDNTDRVVLHAKLIVE